MKKLLLILICFFLLSCDEEQTSEIDYDLELEYCKNKCLEEPDCSYTMWCNAYNKDGIWYIWNNDICDVAGCSYLTTRDSDCYLVDTNKNYQTY